jgi:hypothetical protein
MVVRPARPPRRRVDNLLRRSRAACHPWAGHATVHASHPWALGHASQVDGPFSLAAHSRNTGLGGESRHRPAVADERVCCPDDNLERPSGNVAYASILALGKGSARSTTRSGHARHQRRHHGLATDPRPRCGGGRPPVMSVTTAPSGLEGEGFPVRRAFAGVDLRALDPFVHMDQMGEVDYAPGEPKGTPWHPHRGFETVTVTVPRLAATSPGSASSPFPAPAACWCALTTVESICVCQSSSPAASACVCKAASIRARSRRSASVRTACRPSARARSARAGPARGYRCAPETGCR